MVKFSVKKPLTVFVAVLAVLVLGVVAYLKMTPDLLPNMDFPYVVIVTTDPGASPEAVESAVTRPMEQSMSTLDQIKSVTSTSQDSVSMVVLEFEDGVNMDTVSVDIQQKINILQGSWDDSVGTPLCAEDQPLHAAGAGGGGVVQRQGCDGAVGFCGKHPHAEAGGHLRRSQRHRQRHGAAAGPYHPQSGEAGCPHRHAAGGYRQDTGRDGQPAGGDPQPAGERQGGHPRDGGVRRPGGRHAGPGPPCSSL